LVRPARRDDAADLARVHIASWQQAYRHVFPADFLSGLDVVGRTERFRRSIEANADLLVAEEEGRVVGFCVSGPADDEGWGEVYAIYVHPEHWGRGFGHELITAAENRLALSGYDRVLLWVIDDHPQARSFYERQGWTLGKPIRIEEIGGVQVTLVRYEKRLPASPAPG
jgi:ribosomal protein S18 acetylase RimI-like enzyme